MIRSIATQHDGATTRGFRFEDNEQAMRLPGASEFRCRLSAPPLARTREFLEYASKRRPGPPAPEDRMCREGLTRERLLFWQCLDQGTIRLMSAPTYCMVGVRWKLERKGAAAGLNTVPTVGVRGLETSVGVVNHRPRLRFGVSVVKRRPPTANDRKMIEVDWLCELPSKRRPRPNSTGQP